MIRMTVLHAAEKLSALTTCARYRSCRNVEGNQVTFIPDGVRICKHKLKFFTDSFSNQIIGEDFAAKTAEIFYDRLSDSPGTYDADCHIAQLSSADIVQRINHCPI